MASNTEYPTSRKRKTSQYEVCRREDGSSKGGNPRKRGQGKRFPQTAEWGKSATEAGLTKKRADRIRKTQWARDNNENKKNHVEHMKENEERLKVDNCKLRNDIRMLEANVAYYRSYLSLCRPHQPPTPPPPPPSQLPHPPPSQPPHPQPQQPQQPPPPLQQLLPPQQQQPLATPSHTQLQQPYTSPPAPTQRQKPLSQTSCKQPQPSFTQPEPPSQPQQQQPLPPQPQPHYHQLKSLPPPISSQSQSHQQKQLLPSHPSKPVQELLPSFQHLLPPPPPSLPQQDHTPQLSPPSIQQPIQIQHPPPPPSHPHHPHQDPHPHQQQQPQHQGQPLSCPHPSVTTRPSTVSAVPTLHVPPVLNKGRRPTTGSSPSLPVLPPDSSITSPDQNSMADPPVYTHVLDSEDDLDMDLLRLLPNGFSLPSYLDLTDEDFRQRGPCPDVEPPAAPQGTDEKGQGQNMLGRSASSDNILIHTPGMEKLLELFEENSFQTTSTHMADEEMAARGKYDTVIKVL